MHQCHNSHVPRAAAVWRRWRLQVGWDRQAFRFVIRSPLSDTGGQTGSSSAGTGCCALGPPLLRQVGPTVLAGFEDEDRHGGNSYHDHSENWHGVVYVLMSNSPGVSMNMWRSRRAEPRPSWGVSPPKAFHEVSLAIFLLGASSVNKLAASALIGSTGLALSRNCGLDRFHRPGPRRPAARARYVRADQVEWLSQPSR